MYPVISLEKYYRALFQLYYNYNMKKGNLVCNAICLHQCSASEKIRKNDARTFLFQEINTKSQ